MLLSRAKLVSSRVMPASTCMIRFIVVITEEKSQRESMRFTASNKAAIKIVYIVVFRLAKYVGRQRSQDFIVHKVRITVT